MWRYSRGVRLPLSIARSRRAVGPLQWSMQFALLAGTASVARLQTSTHRAQKPIRIMRPVNRRLRTSDVCAKHHSRAPRTPEPSEPPTNAFRPTPQPRASLASPLQRSTWSRVQKQPYLTKTSTLPRQRRAAQRLAGTNSSTCNYALAAP